jgi:iron complex transport system permease protein
MAIATTAAAGSSPRYAALMIALVCTMVVVAILSLFIGPAAIGLDDLLGLFARDQGDVSIMIMREIRLPRTLLGLMVGATLGLSGATLQGYLRNPLADPAIIGISSSASFGAVVAIYSGFALLFPLAAPLSAIGGALLCVLAMLGLAGRGATLTLILAGVAISSLTAALTDLALNLSPNPYAALEIVFWMMGSLTDRTLEHVALAGPFMIVGWILLGLAARSLDALSLGEEVASSLGVNLGRTRLLVVAGTAVSVGAATAVSGLIGFVGLIVPHLLRPMVGHRPGRLLPASALGGAILLTLSDILVRVITPGKELRIGVLTALIGAPFFLSLVLRLRAGGRS